MGTKEKASMVVMSHLSNAQEMMNKGIPLWANNYINFAKYVVMKCKGDLTQEINPKALWRTFAETRFYKS